MGDCRYQIAFSDLTFVLCLYVISEQLGALVGFSTVGTGVVSDSCLLWDPFAPTELPHPILIGWYAPHLIVACYAVFGLCP